MYDIQFKGKKVQKQFEKFLQRLSKNVKNKIRNTLENNPYPSPSYGEILCKVERKGKIYGIEPTGGDRILYDIIKIEEDKKIILIHFVGDDDDEIRYLKDYAK